MEKTTIKGSLITVSDVVCRRVCITQDSDIVLVEDEDIEEFIAAIRKHARIVTCASAQQGDEEQ